MTEGIQQVATHHGSLFSWSPARIDRRFSANGYARVGLHFSEAFGSLGAGQFVLLRIPGRATLPRAFSPLRSAPDDIELLVKLDGTLREALGGAPPGTVVEVRGPYGVPYADRIHPDHPVLLVGGGSGVAPLLLFRDQHPQRVAGAVFGFRTGAVARLFPGEDLVIEERDGRRADAVAAQRRRAGVDLVACGPHAMLQALAQRYPGDPDVYVSLETRIGCGIGTCLGCSIDTTRGLRRICRDGPLFPARELLWRT